MASGATVKMGVDVTQFKQGMQQAQQSAKTLNAQMKANESQFKATGDKEKYLTEKSKLLKEQLNAQKTAAANAEKALEAMRKNGVEKTSTEYQKMEQALAGAQSAMYDTQAAMNALTTSEGKAADGASTLSTNLNSISKKVSFDAVITGIDKITGGLEKAAQKALQVGQGIWETIVDTAALSDDYVTMASQLDMSVEDFQKYKKVFDTYAELTIKDWMNAKRKIEGVIYNPSQTQIDYLQALGIDTRESINTGNNLAVVQGAAKKWEDVFWEVATALKQKVESGEMTAELADTYGEALFGKAFMQYKPMIDMGEEAFKKAVSDQSAADKKSMEAGAALNDSLILLKGNIETIKLQILGALAPALTKAADSLSGLLNSVMEYLQTPEGQKALQDMETAVSGLFDDLGKIDPAQVVEGFTGVFNRIVEGLQWLDTNKETLADALKIIVGGWALAKVTGGALTVLELVNGLITLKNTRKIDIPQLDGNGGLNGGGGGSTGQQTVTSQDVASQNVQSGTITSGTFNFTSGSTQTETVQTMYVQNMIGGPNGTPNVPTVPTGVPKVSGSDMVNLNAASGGALTSGTGYNLTAGGGFNLNAADETLKIDAGSTRILLGDGTEIETAGPIRMDGMINAGTGKVIADGAFDAFGQQFAATHPLADKVINTVFSPQGLAALGVIAGIPLIAQASKYLETRAAGVEKFGEGYKSFTHREKKIADGNSPLDNGDYETVEDVKAAAEKQKKIDKALMPEWLRWTVDLSDSVDNTAEAIAGTAAEIYNIGKEAVNLPFEVLNAAIFNDSHKGQMVIDMAGMVLGGAAQKAGGFFGTIGKMADIVGGMAEKKAQTWAIEASAAVIQDFINPMKQSINDIFAKTYQMMVQITPTGNSKFDYFSPTSGGGTTTWFSRLVGTTSSMHANGLFSVPWDGYPAILHKGERVLTARENQQYTYNNYFGNVNLNNGLEIEALTESIDRRNRRQRNGYGAA